MKRKTDQTAVALQKTFFISTMILFIFIFVSLNLSYINFDLKRQIAWDGLNKILAGLSNVKTSAYTSVVVLLIIVLPVIRDIIFLCISHIRQQRQNVILCLINLTVLTAAIGSAFYSG